MRFLLSAHSDPWLESAWLTELAAALARVWERLRVLEDEDVAGIWITKSVNVVARPGGRGGGGGEGEGGEGGGKGGEGGGGKMGGGPGGGWFTMSEEMLVIP